MSTKTNFILGWIITPIGIAIITAVIFNFNKDTNIMAQGNTFPSQVEVAFGQSGISLEQRYGDLITANKKNFGLNFYDIDADARGRTILAIIKTGTLMTSIPNTMAIDATEDRNRNVGITNLLVMAKVKEGGMQPHPVAHQYVMELVRNLRKTGWRYRMFSTDPRLKGQAAFDYYKEENLDPDYPLTFEQWMALPRPLTWRFYADHTYLSLKVERDINHLDSAKPGAYYISLTFQPREEVERLEVDEKDRDNWRATWVERYRKYRAERNLAEAKLRAKGIPIDTHYQEPPLPPPPAGQHNPTIPDDLK